MKKRKRTRGVAYSQKFRGCCDRAAALTYNLQALKGIQAQVIACRKSDSQEG